MWSVAIADWKKQVLNTRRNAMDDLEMFITEAFQWLSSATTVWKSFRMLRTAFGRIRLLFCASGPELMRIEEAAAYAGVSSSTIRRKAKLHPEIELRDGNGQNPRYIRDEVNRLLIQAPNRGKSIR